MGHSPQFIDLLKARCFTKFLKSRVRTGTQVISLKIKFILKTMPFMYEPCSPGLNIMAVLLIRHSLYVQEGVLDCWDPHPIHEGCEDLPSTTVAPKAHSGYSGKAPSHCVAPPFLPKACPRVMEALLRNVRCALNSVTSDGLLRASLV